MKKKMIVITAVVVFLLIAFLIRENMMLKGQINENDVSSIPKKNYDMLSMMLETKANSGNYEMTTKIVGQQKDIFLTQNYQNAKMGENFPGIMKRKLYL